MARTITTARRSIAKNTIRRCFRKVRAVNFSIRLLCTGDLIPAMKKVIVQVKFIQRTFIKRIINDPKANSGRPIDNKSPTLAAGGIKEAATATPIKAVPTPLTKERPAAMPEAIAKPKSATFGFVRAIISFGNSDSPEM